MRTIETTATMTDEGTLTVQVPPDIPSGPHRVVVEIDDQPRMPEARPLHALYVPVGMRRAICAWAMVLGLVGLIMAGPTSAQPVDIPPTWGATSGPAPGSPAAGVGCGTNSGRKVWWWTSTCCRRPRALSAVGETNSGGTGG